MNSIKNTVISAFALLMLIGMGQLTHIHDDKCGYNPKTGDGCIYEEIDPLFEWDPER